ncbi:MAG: hypothetical protein KGY39_07550 [Anaerolineales bacterium]|nr:hypothetical protein [Anaerolineales bacterium]MBS3753458.1 hypothetical protein [Anaerolineales bacterium]
MNLINDSLLIWIVVAGIGLLVLRFILNVTKKVLSIGFIVLVVVAIYILISNYLAQPALP